MNILNQEQWYDLFLDALDACEQGDMNLVHHLFNKDYAEKQWIVLHESGIHQDGEEGFRLACENGHLEVVRFLLTSPLIKEFNLGQVNLHAWSEYGFCQACANGHLEVVKYLLTSPELIEAGHTFANLAADDHFAIKIACKNGQLEVLKYLLTSPELIESGHEFADIHVWGDLPFKYACNHEKWDVVRWLVMDYKIEKTPDIEEKIIQEPQAQEYFRAREELNEIHKTISSSSNVNDERILNDKRKIKKL